MTSFTYDENIFSDLYKDANGFRPRGHEFYTASPERKQEIWDFTFDCLEDTIRYEAAMQEQAIIDFEDLVDQTIAYGAADFEEAVRWLTSGETFANEQCVEGYVWSQGLLNTKYGKRLAETIRRVNDIPTWEQWYEAA